MKQITPPPSAPGEPGKAPVGAAPGKVRWEPMRLQTLGSINDVAMPGILKGASVLDGSGTRKSGIG